MNTVSITVPTKVQRLRWSVPVFLHNCTTKAVTGHTYLFICLLPNGHHTTPTIKAGVALIFLIIVNAAPQARWLRIVSAVYPIGPIGPSTPMGLTLQLFNPNAHCFCASPTGKFDGSLDILALLLCSPVYGDGGPGWSLPWCVELVKRWRVVILLLSWKYVAMGLDDSEVRIVRMCSWWKCLRGPLPTAWTCSPQLLVRLRGLAHFGGETCARKDQRSKTDVYTSFVYKECSELLLLFLVRTEKWRSLYTLYGVSRDVTGTRPPHSLLWSS